MDDAKAVVIDVPHDPWRLAGNPAPAVRAEQAALGVEHRLAAAGLNRLPYPLAGVGANGAAVQLAVRHQNSSSSNQILPTLKPLL